MNAEDTLRRSKGQYKRVIALVADTHVGSRYSLCGPVWIGKEGGNIASGRNAGQKMIYQYWQYFLKTCDKWNVDTVIFFGDLINGTNRRESGLGQMTSDLDEQKRHLVDLATPLCENRVNLHVSGSGYHDSLDTRVHFDIADMLHGKYLGNIANVQLDGTKRMINISHGASAAFVYRTMIMSREALFMSEAIQLGKLPNIDMIIRGHWHKFIHIHMEQIHILQLPGWEAFVPWHGALLSYGKFQPDIGACILFIDKEDRMIVLPFTMKSIPHIGDSVWES
jgi:hypothetical protein